MKLLRTNTAATDQDLTVCSLCLRVRSGSRWVDAEQVIRPTRSYDRRNVPHLHSVICDDCADGIFERRAERHERVAA